MRLSLIMFLTLGICLASFAQPALKSDTVVTTTHQLRANGQSIAYKAFAGMQPVWDDSGKEVASLHYTYYEKQGVENKEDRPLVISFNGGPGSGSVWMHIAYTGPALLNIDDEGYPVQPYGIKENPYSILDVADIVYIDPVNTGFSRILSDDVNKSMFFGVNADIKYLANWISTFVTRNNRWNSPKYLIGESYGTTRVSGLALELQNSQWMYLNGVVLVSPTDLGITRDRTVSAANRLPYFTATAYYHNKLAPELQNRQLEDLLEEAEEFTINKLLPAIAKGHHIGPEEKAYIIKEMSRYTSLSESVIAQNNLDISTSLFWKELKREDGYTVGRLDSRYLGVDVRDAGERPDYNAELTSWLHSFTPAINYYYRNVLDFKTDVRYNMFGPVHPWDGSNNRTGYNLRQAMAANPFLNVMVQSGYFDGATDYFNAKYNLWHMDPSGKLAPRMSFKAYKSGHMMYLRKEDLIQANEDIRQFILSTIPEDGQPAKY